MFRSGGDLGTEYDATELRNGAMRVLGVGMIGVLSWMVLVNAWGDPRGVTVLLAIAVWFAGTWAATRLLVRPTILVDDVGVSIVNPFARHRVAWSEMLSVTLGNGPVRIHPRRGRPIPLWASVELAPVRGEHPHADRVARALSEQLEAARQRHRSANRHPG